MAHTFRNRTEAGRTLANKLSSYQWNSPLVLALPRGGVPVAAEIARALEGSLDVLVVKKIGAPDQEELAIGAVAEEGEPYWNHGICQSLDLGLDDLKKMAEEKRSEIKALRRKWNLPHKPPNAFGREVILVDDGIATGATVMAAIEILRQQKPAKIILAAPVASSQAVSKLKPVVDNLEVLFIPDHFRAVGLWYKDFTQVEDDEMLRVLENRSEAAYENIVIDDGFEDLPGRLDLPDGAIGVVIFAHGSGSTHKSPRNKRVADALNKLKLGTLRFDLLTADEAQDRANVFNVELLSHRLAVATRWLRGRLKASPLPIAYFGASTGAAAALTAASRDPEIFAVVSRGGRPDMAFSSLPQVVAPTLLMVGGEDGAVIPLNENACERLKNGKLVVIRGAGHLFEEAGAMEKVIEFAGNWFLGALRKAEVKKAGSPVEEIVYEMSQNVVPYKKDHDLDQLVARMSQARVVMLGESSHGTEEFYQIRKIISQKLIADYGFKFIAVEGDWPDCASLDRYIKGRDKNKTAAAIMSRFTRWPTWMWANQQTSELIEWLKGRGAGFYGLDVYSLNESLEVLKGYAERVSPDVAEAIGMAYGCFEPYERSEASYSAKLLRLPEGCKEEAISCLNKLVRTRLENTQLDVGELFDARQNAMIIKNADQYFRALAKGGADSWNVRDQHMMETLDALLRLHGEGARAIVWAHNTHIGDYHATSMVDEGYINLGGLARERYGIENVFLVGLGTYEGQVLAGEAWAAKPQVMNVPPAKRGSYEAYFHQIAEQTRSDRLILPMEKEASLPSLTIRRGHRAIGVVYQSRFEERGHNYVPTSLRDRYDAFIFFDKSTALKPIATHARKGLLPETWPTGI